MERKIMRRRKCKEDVEKRAVRVNIYRIEPLAGKMMERSNKEEDEKKT